MRDSSNKKIFLDLKADIAAYQNGEISEKKFQAIRVHFGIHAIRDRKTVMLRIRIPGGHLEAAQARVIATVIDEHCPTAWAHLTTRQDFQFYELDLKTLPDILQRLDFFGLNSILAGGKSVRNIVAPPDAGFNQNEIFDVLPWVRAIDSFFIQHLEYSGLPAKIKMAFAAQPGASLYADYNDIAVYARSKDNKEGFEIKAGGGLGNEPQRAVLVNEFIPASALLHWLLAILRHFKNHGAASDGKNRLKYLVRRLGENNYRRQIHQEAAQKFEAPFLDVLDWKKTNQPDYSFAEIECPLGQITAPALNQAADFADRIGGGVLRLTPWQNLLLPQLKKSYLSKVYACPDISQAAAVRVVSCPGPKYCRLGQLQSRALSMRLLEDLKNENFDPEDPLRVHVSGCRNGCGHHRLADIGWNGVVAKVDGKPSPQFNLVLGANNRNANLARDFIQIPSRRVPEATRRMVQWYAARRQPGESGSAFFNKAGISEVRSQLQDLTAQASPGPDVFLEHDDERPFKPGAIGASDCA